MAKAKSPSDELSATAKRISKETGVKVEDVEKVLKAGYASTMEFVINRVKAEMSKSRAGIDVGNIDQLKNNAVVRDVAEPVLR